MKVIKGNIILWPITNRDVLPTMLMITPTSLSMMPIIYPWSLCLFHSPMSLLWKMFCLCHHAYHNTCHTACLRKPHTCRNRQNMLHVGLWPLICLICFLLIGDIMLGSGQVNRGPEVMLGGTLIGHKLETSWQGRLTLHGVHVVCGWP